MLKWLVILVIVFAVAFAYFGGLWQNRDKIHHAEMDLLKMRSMRDSLQAVVNFRDSLQSSLQKEIRLYRTDAEILRTQIQMLEARRRDNQLTVRRLNKKEDLQARLRETFPEMAESDWGVTEVHNEAYHVDLEYLLIPLWFSETFILDHENAENWRAQRDSLQLLDSLNICIITLQDSVHTLERQNRLAYETGYNFAYQKYDSLNTEYIRLLKKGRIHWGWQTLGIVGGGVAGTVIGYNIKP